MRPMIRHRPRWLGTSRALAGHFHLSGRSQALRVRANLPREFPGVSVESVQPLTLVKKETRPDVRETGFVDQSQYGLAQGLSHPFLRFAQTIGLATLVSFGSMTALPGCGRGCQRNKPAVTDAPEKPDTRHLDKIRAFCNKSGVRYEDAAALAVKMLPEPLRTPSEWSRLQSDQLRKMVYAALAIPALLLKVQKAGGSQRPYQAVDVVMKKMSNLIRAITTREYLTVMLRHVVRGTNQDIDYTIPILLAVLKELEAYGPLELLLVPYDGVQKKRHR